MRLGNVLIIGSLLGSICVFNSSAQEIDSTLLLNEVAVRASVEPVSLPGNNFIVPDEQDRLIHSASNLSSLLATQSSIYFKEYGNGMLSTVSFRGTNASQTAVMWNNFSVNSFTLGQMDFGLLPTVATDEITIIPGSGSNQGGSGAFGGAVLLDNHLKGGNFIQVQQSLGSFNHLQSALTGEIHFDKLAINSKIYHKTAENDFPILGTDKNQPNASYQQSGLVNHLQYTFSKNHKIEAQFWLHDNFRQIQPLKSSYIRDGEGRNQEDENLRTAVSYVGSVAKFEYKLGTGYFTDIFKYNDGNASSEFTVRRWESYANLVYKTEKAGTFRVNYRQNLIKAYNYNYVNGTTYENRYSVNLHYGTKILEDIQFAVQIKQQLVSGSVIPLTPYVGVDWKLIKQPNQQLKIKANTSYNYRLPTLNDRFWRGLGNPDLKAETAFNKEIGAHYKRSISNTVAFNASATFYHNKVDNWIQWSPVLGGSRPENKIQVTASGIETELGFEWIISRNWHLNASSLYTLSNSIITKSEDHKEIGKQVIYTPRHKLNTSINLSIYQLVIHTNWRYNGKVYTTDYNTELFSLDGFNLIDLGISYPWKRFHFNTTVKNILNTNYQLYAGYAQPGINFNIGINYTLNFNN